MFSVGYKDETLGATLNLLAKGGKGVNECVVLWLGKRRNREVVIENVYLPAQRASVDFFHIPNESMKELMRYLKVNKLMVAAQVHTHPGKAFHSKADDEWAFVRHEGAISIVLPCFAKNITKVNFMQNAAVYSLSKSNSWEEMQGIELSERCKKIK